jgi:hypothetical protein
MARVKLEEDPEVLEAIQFFKNMSSSGFLGDTLESSAFNFTLRTYLGLHVEIQKGTFKFNGDASQLKFRRVKDNTARINSKEMAALDAHRGPIKEWLMNAISDKLAQQNIVEVEHAKSDA